ncbi:hypothetical protein BDD12DRAFT_886156 [Trichophaea hybrida]|nr:hypothetical protein BDD12DRAFT_886156 [Trichophaea hybrida]
MTLDTIDYLALFQGHSRNAILQAMGKHFSRKFPGISFHAWIKYIHGISPSAAYEGPENEIITWIVAWVLVLTTRRMTLEEAPVMVDEYVVPRFRIVPTPAGHTILFSPPSLFPPSPTSPPSHPPPAPLPPLLSPSPRPIAVSTSPRRISGPPLPLFRRGGGLHPTAIFLTVEMRYKCSLCDSTHDRQGTLRRHFKVHINGEIKCPLDGCAWWGYRTDKLWMHVRGGHAQVRHPTPVPTVMNAPTYDIGDPTVVEMGRAVAGVM